MSGLGDNIVVNGFMFCERHGGEYCPYCTCDHRYGNNGVHDLHNALQELVDDAIRFDLEERTPQNAYERGAVRVQPRSEDFKCQTHNVKDCGTCFDWVGIVRKEIEDVIAQDKWRQKKKKYFDRTDTD
ncbi:uncharacterized protein LAESUDRAFT_705679 [Laetiporus sulphureus 93-53]|uniref:Uncharacterized protein n=1 Tax=Laetiporus sulphureus 93-53 TaxID=1314785 RepID=A0A165CEM5_9APHY|nr:uncharacterized protein LAESUDRAFT_705679 [Laetiporus sulphureus 93-53]KZT02676.1 hypothetical protein LAESUDRAFT_705679 [Laetiporus sulphureus 93-53]